MSGDYSEIRQNGHEAAFAAGKQTGLAIGGLAASAVAFISLLGIEKAILAIVLSVLAFRGAQPGAGARRLSKWAILIASAYVLTYILVLVLFHDRLAELVRLMQQLG